MRQLITKKYKKVWCWGEKWDVVEVLEPTKYDQYILVQRKDDAAHDDGTQVVIMGVIDCGNDEFYPVNSTTDRYMRSIKSHQQNAHSFERKLNNIWLDQFKH